MVIAPEDWVFRYSHSVARDQGKEPAPDDWEVRWSVVPLFVDRYTPPEVPDATREYPNVLVSNLENGRHTLTLLAKEGAVSGLRALRVYKPPLAVAE